MPREKGPRKGCRNLSGVRSAQCKPHCETLRMARFQLLDEGMDAITVQTMPLLGLRIAVACGCVALTGFAVDWGAAALWGAAVM